MGRAGVLTHQYRLTGTIAPPELTASKIVSRKVLPGRVWQVRNLLAITGNCRQFPTNGALRRATGTTPPVFFR